MAPRPHNEPRVLVTPEELVGYEIDGRYTIESVLGEGGMGVVFRTVQRSLSRPVALKLLRLDELDQGQRLERFRREIAIVGGLSHPNIVQVYDTGIDPQLGLDYIAMELIEGLPLDELLRGRQAHPAFALEIVRQVCAGLTEPHGRGIIHRDIKPGNILLSARSDDRLQVKVVDFGIARAAMAESDGRITTTGTVVGSPAYMAPEMTRGETVDGRTDLYAVGVILYELLTGRIPFDGNTPMAIMLRHAAEEPPSLLDALPDFPHPEIAELLDDLLAKDPDDRPADARAALRRIDRLRDTLDLPTVVVAADQPPAQALARWILQPPDPVDPLARTHTSGLPTTGEGPSQQMPTEILTAPMPQGGAPTEGRGSTQPWAGGAGTGARPIQRTPSPSGTTTDTAETRSKTSSPGWMIPASARLPGRTSAGTQTADPVPPTARRDRTTFVLTAVAGLMVVLTAAGGWWLYSALGAEQAEGLAPEDEAALAAPVAAPAVVPEPPAASAAAAAPAMEFDEPEPLVVQEEMPAEEEPEAKPEEKPAAEEKPREVREEAPRRPKAQAPKPAAPKKETRREAAPKDDAPKDDELQQGLDWLKDR